MSENLSVKENENHYAVFGNTIIPRGKCPKCGRQSFIIDENFVCCGERAGKINKFYKSESAAENRRYTPSINTKKEILQNQNYRCIYCEKSFDGYVWRKGKGIKLKVAWDHFLPFCFSYNNHETNFLAACQICNGIKSDLVFDSIQEAQTYIQTKREEKGYNYEMFKLSEENDNDQEDAKILLEQMSSKPLRENKKPAIKRRADSQRVGGNKKHERINNQARDKKRKIKKPEKIRANIGSQSLCGLNNLGFDVFIKEFNFSNRNFADYASKNGFLIGKSTVSRLRGGNDPLSEEYGKKVVKELSRIIKNFLISRGLSNQEADQRLYLIFDNSEIKVKTQTILIQKGVSSNFVFKDEKGKVLQVLVFN